MIDPEEARVPFLGLRLRTQPGGGGMAVLAAISFCTCHPCVDGVSELAKPSPKTVHGQNTIRRCANTDLLHICLSMASVGQVTGLVPQTASASCGTRLYAQTLLVVLARMQPGTLILHGTRKRTALQVKVGRDRNTMLIFLALCKIRVLLSSSPFS